MIAINFETTIRSLTPSKKLQIKKIITTSPSHNKMSFELVGEKPTTEGQSYHLKDDIKVEEQREIISTKHGNIHVVREGNSQNRRTLLTLHDVALNRLFKKKPNTTKKKLTNKNRWKLL